MVKEIYTIEKIKQQLHPIFKKYNVRKAILFGSYAKGNAHSNSDIDIMVDSGLRGLAFYGLLEDVVTALDKPIDLIDKTQIVDSSEIEKAILQTGVMIYG